ncbi:D-3-phosphoglycerate dehydrogenase [Corchorus olitorius]|uniref:D-3-phosphoglycerate dehydrogenase n=1 Tax=Corchorus olitorius TaxID=93759 RepID=A0A1R3IFL0_9ROSI|nr:D-3-phosphoglycerate dehydrogenase [Corchorus olitorius]
MGVFLEGRGKTGGALALRNGGSGVYWEGMEAELDELAWDTSSRILQGNILVFQNLKLTQVPSFNEICGHLPLPMAAPIRPSITFSFTLNPMNPP